MAKFFSELNISVDLAVQDMMHASDLLPLKAFLSLSYAHHALRSEVIPTSEIAKFTSTKLAKRPLL